MNHHIWKGTMILTVAAVFVKLLSAVYRLPYQNLAGDVGFYVYQQIYPFYALAVVMGGTGFPIVISKLMAEESIENSQRTLNNVFVNAWLAVTSLSLVLFVFLYGGAPYIALAMSDPGLAQPLRMISFIYLFVPFLAVLRGFFQGKTYNMSPTALSQVGEQALRVAMILGLSLILFYNDGTPYQFGTAASFGSMIAPIASLGILLFFFIKHVKKEPLHLSRIKMNVPLIKKIGLEGLGFSLLSLTLVCFQFIDVLSLVPLLEHFDWDQAKVLKGTYDRAYPLIQLGMVAALALTTALIPAFTKARGALDRQAFNDQAKLSLRVSIVFGMAASVGLALVGEETNRLLFEDSSGTLSLIIMSFNIISVSIIVAAAGILQGLSSTWVPVRYLLVAMVCKLLLNLLLVPWFGITGAALATVMSSAGAAFLNLRRVQKSLRIVALERGHVKKLVMALILMSILIVIWKVLVFWAFGLDGGTRGQAALIALSSVAIGASTFLFSLIKMKFFTKIELGNFAFFK